MLRRATFKPQEARPEKQKRSAMQRSAPLANTLPMLKRCSVCPKDFAPARPMQRVCSPRCAAAEVRKVKRAERTLDRSRKLALKTRADWMREAQAAVNRYVRARDAHLGCVSCDKGPTWDGQWHASHFRSVGAASAVRFHLWNIHKSCSICNNWKSGNLSEYEPRLRARIGADRVDWLRTQTQLVAYDIEYLRRLKRVFGKKARRMEARNG